MKIDYNKTNSVIDVKAQYTLDSALRIGGTDADREDILRTGDGVPFLSSSSIKGVVRSEFNRMPQAKENIECDIPGFGTVGLTWTDILFGFGSRELDNGKRLSVQGAINTSDAVLEGSTTELRTHVRIDRKSRSAEDGGLFDSRVVSPGFKLELKFRLNNVVETTPIGILFFILDELGKGNISVGANSTIGLGRLSATHYEVTVRNKPGQILGVAEPFTLSGEDLSVMAPNLADYLKKN